METEHGPEPVAERGDPAVRWALVVGRMVAQNTGRWMASCGEGAPGDGAKNSLEASGDEAKNSLLAVVGVGAPACASPEGFSPGSGAAPSTPAPGDEA